MHLAAGQAPRDRFFLKIRDDGHPALRRLDLPAEPDQRGRFRGARLQPAAGGAPGPLHNKIAQPDRKMDGGATDNNSTIWKADFSSLVTKAGTSTRKGTVSGRA